MTDRLRAYLSLNQDAPPAALRALVVAGNFDSLDTYLSPVIEMTKSMSVVLYVVVLITAVVSVDLLFFKNRFWERLIVNIGIVLVFAAFYLRFLKNP